MRIIVAVLPASIITLVLFSLMQYLITSGHRPVVRTDAPGVVELIRLQSELPEQQTPAPASAGRPHAPEHPPPVPQAPGAQAQSPQLPPPGIDRPPVQPLQIVTAPSLGAFTTADAAPTPKGSRTAAPVQAALPDPGAARPAASGAGGSGDDGSVLPLLRVEPVYPRKAARERREGWVKVEFTISERGTVIDPVVVESRPRRIFNRSALAAIRKWRFKPRVVSGKPVASRATQVIEFRLAGR